VLARCIIINSGNSPSNPTDQPQHLFFPRFDDDLGPRFDSIARGVGCLHDKLVFSDGAAIPRSLPDAFNYRSRQRLRLKRQSHQDRTKHRAECGSSPNFAYTCTPVDLKALQAAADGLNAALAAQAHGGTAAKADTGMSTALRSVGFLDVLLSLIVVWQRGKRKRQKIYPHSLAFP
jgi:hypothetical protein